MSDTTYQAGSRASQVIELFMSVILVNPHNSNAGHELTKATVFLDAYKILYTRLLYKHSLFYVRSI